MAADLFVDTPITEAFRRNPTSPTPSELLFSDEVADGWRLDGPEHLWGFGGLQGGLALAALTRAMAGVEADLGALRSVTGQFLRPLRGQLGVEASLVRRGRSAGVTAGALQSSRGVGLTATATFGTTTTDTVGDGPPMPEAGRPDDHHPFGPPPEFVPVSRYTEIRPVGAARPYGGGDQASLTAWIRLVHDDAPVDALRLIVLADALAPAYSAVLSDLVMVPTVELTARPGVGIASSSSPWVLLRATSDAVAADGWVNERIDAWGPDGTHLGGAHQLRVVVAPAAA